MPAPRLVLVAGATGYLGKYIVQELKQQGYRVRALARAANKLGGAEQFADEVFVGEATKPETLTGLCDGVDTVISTLGITRQTDKVTYEDVDFMANERLMDMSEEAGVRRFIFVSVLNAHFVAHTDMVVAKEKAVTALKGKRMEWIVIRPGGFYCDINEFLDMAKGGCVFYFGDGTTEINPIHGADLAVVCVDHIDGESNVEVPCGGPEVLNWRQIGQLAFEACGKKSMFIGVPLWLMDYVVLPPLKIFARRWWNIVAFMSAAGRHNMVAPKYGHRTLAPFFKQTFSGEAVGL